jgi:hypothetical protein
LPSSVLAEIALLSLLYHPPTRNLLKTATG